MGEMASGQGNRIMDATSVLFGLWYEYKFLLQSCSKVIVSLQCLTLRLIQFTMLCAGRPSTARHDVSTGLQGPK